MRTVSRRAFLAVGSVTLLAGCRDRPPARPDPDAAALASARDTEVRLVLAFSGPERDRHLAHLAALGGTAPTLLPPPGGPIPPTALVQSSVPSLQAAAIGAHSGKVAAVLASIAAAHLAQQAKS